MRRTTHRLSVHQVENLYLSVKRFRFRIKKIEKLFRFNILFFKIESWNHFVKDDDRNCTRHDCTQLHPEPAQRLLASRTLLWDYQTSSRSFAVQKFRRQTYIKMSMEAFDGKSHLVLSPQLVEFFFTQSRDNNGKRQQ